MKSRRFYAEPPVITSSVVSVTVCTMKQFPMRTETDQLAQGIGLYKQFAALGIKEGE